MEQADWIALLSKDDGLRLQAGASNDDLQSCEARLGVALPSNLRNLYLASNGVWDEPGQWFVVWPLDEVVERNRLSSEASRAGRAMWIGFADDGTGNPFCVDRLGGEEVHYWSSIDECATRIAANLSAFWVSWADGSLPSH